MIIFKCFSFQINPDKNCPLGASGNAYIKTVWLKNETFLEDTYEHTQIRKTQKMPI